MAPHAQGGEGFVVDDGGTCAGRRRPRRRRWRRMRKAAVAASSTTMVTRAQSAICGQNVDGPGKSFHPGPS